MRERERERRERTKERKNGRIKESTQQESVTPKFGDVPFMTALRQFVAPRTPPEHFPARCQSTKSQTSQKESVSTPTGEIGFPPSRCSDLGVGFRGSGSRRRSPCFSSFRGFEESFGKNLENSGLRMSSQVM